MGVASAEILGSVRPKHTRGQQPETLSWSSSTSPHGPRVRQSYLRTVENALKQADEPGVSFALIGEAVVVRRYSALARKDLTQAERVSLPITFAVLGVAFLSVIAAALPIALAVVSLVVTLAFLSLVSLNAGLSPFVLNTAAGGAGS